MPSLILAFALTVAPLTSTRQGEAYGISDLVLLVAVVIVAAASLNRSFRGFPLVAETEAGLHGADAVRPTLIYSCAAMFLIIISALANWTMINRVENPALSAAGYVVSFAMVLALYLQAAGTGLRNTMLAYSVFSLVLMVIYLGGYLAGFEAFFFYHRFIGLSENPNQTALHMLCVIVVSAAALTKLELFNSVWRWLLGTNILLAAILGLLSDSDAFGFALIVTIVVGMLHLLALRSGESVTSLGLTVFVLLPLALAGVLLVVDDFGELTAQVLDRLQFGNQDSDRLVLWSNGVLAWQERWLLGNGPGGWSGLSGPFQGKEAHNTLIDWMSIAGVIGLAAYVWLLTKLFRRKLRYYLVSYYSLLGLMTFTMFHFTLRHPIFWFALVALYMASQHRRADGYTTERFAKGAPSVEGSQPAYPQVTPA